MPRAGVGVLVSRHRRSPNPRHCQMHAMAVTPGDEAEAGARRAWRLARRSWQPASAGAGFL